MSSPPTKPPLRRAGAGPRSARDHPRHGVAQPGDSQRGPDEAEDGNRAETEQAGGQAERRERCRDDDRQDDEGASEAKQDPGHAPPTTARSAAEDERYHRQGAWREDREDAGDEREAQDEDHGGEPAVAR